MTVHIKKASKFHHIPGNNSLFADVCVCSCKWASKMSVRLRCSGRFECYHQMAGENHEMSKCGSDCRTALIFNLFWLLRVSMHTNDTLNKCFALPWPHRTLNKHWWIFLLPFARKDVDVSSICWPFQLIASYVRTAIGWSSVIEMAWCLTLNSVARASVNVYYICLHSVEFLYGCCLPFLFHPVCVY